MNIHDVTSCDELKSLLHTNFVDQRGETFLNRDRLNETKLYLKTSTIS